MDKEAFLNILKKYRAGEANDEEAAFLHAYYNLFDVHESSLEEMDASTKRLLKEEIKAEIDLKIAQAVIPVKENFWRLSQMLVAAAVLVIVGVAIFFINEWPSISNNALEVTVEAKVKDIAPGGNHAMLTLSDGSVLKLDDQKDGLLTTEAGAVISKTKDGELVYKPTGKAAVDVFNTISTPKGGQYQLMLSDGTKVWLNAASSIRFPTAFNEKYRNVEITGEVYFEVAGNKKKPFKVFSEYQEIEVLGTHFNVNTYGDEQFDKTTLLEGSVKVSRINSDGKKQAFETIKPGEVAIALKEDGELKVVQVRADDAVAWKNGYFKFDRTDLKTIMRQVSRWYNVDVVYKGDFDTDLFGGKIRRTDSVSGVLRVLKLSNINATIKGRTIIISN
jgi:transmembrane sensor